MSVLCELEWWKLGDIPLWTAEWGSSTASPRYAHRSLSNPMDGWKGMKVLFSPIVWNAFQENNF